MMAARGECQQATKRGNLVEGTMDSVQTQRGNNANVGQEPLLLHQLASCLLSVVRTTLGYYCRQVLL